MIKKPTVFILRTDVFFQDDDVFPDGQGRRLIASDIVLQSFPDYLTKKLPAAEPGFSMREFQEPKPFSAPDDSTFELQSADSISIRCWVCSACSIVPLFHMKWWKNMERDFRSHPCGTGPFQFKSWEEGQDLILVKNEHYFEKDSAGYPLPYLDAVKISFFDNRATEFLLLQQDRLDFMNDIDPSFKDEVLNKKGELKKEWIGRIQLSTSPYLNTEYLGIVVDSSLPAVQASPLQIIENPSGHQLWI